MYHEDENEKPLWQITVGDFQEMIEKIVANRVEESLEQIRKTIQDSNIDPDEDLIKVEEASKITNLSIPTIYTKVSRMEMPSKSRGRPLLFSKKELKVWIVEGRPKNF